MYNYFVPSLDENYSSIKPKNITHVLWRNINTAEQFKTGGVTDKKITAHPQLHQRHCDSSLWPQQVEGGGGAQAVSLSLQCRDRFHSKRRSRWPDETSARSKNKIWRGCLASVRSSSQNRLKQSPEIAEDMKIYNSQLVMSLVYRSTLELLQSTLQVYVTTTAWCRGMHVWAPSRLASCVIRCKNKTTGLCTSFVGTNFQERQSKGGLKDTAYKYQAVPDHPATATQLPY